MFDRGKSAGFLLLEAILSRLSASGNHFQGKFSISGFTVAKSKPQSQQKRDSRREMRTKTRFQT